jgi:integrase/recombinase XerD
MSFPRSEKTDAVFLSCRGAGIKHTRLHYIIKKASREAGISEKASSHWLRHSHATEAIEPDCDLHLLQLSLGHSSLAVTSKYLHARPDQSSSEFFED